MFGISRVTAYKFIDRYKKHGIEGLEELSRAPRRIANKTQSRIESEIIRLRGKHPRWGAEKLLVLLEDNFPKKQLPKPSTVNLILKQNGLIKERKRRRIVEPQNPIFDPQVPNEVWSADFKGKFRMGNGKYCYPDGSESGYYVLQETATEVCDRAGSAVHDDAVADRAIDENRVGSEGRCG